MISEDRFLKTFVNEKTRIGAARANLLDRVLLGQLHFSLGKRRMLGHVAHQLKQSGREF